MSTAATPVPTFTGQPWPTGTRSHGPWPSDWTGSWHHHHTGFGTASSGPAADSAASTAAAHHGPTINGSTAAFAGLVAGLCVLVVLSVVAAIFLIRRRRRRNAAKVDPYANTPVPILTMDAEKAQPKPSKSFSTSNSADMTSKPASAAVMARGAKVAAARLGRASISRSPTAGRGWMLLDNSDDEEGSDGESDDGSFGRLSATSMSDAQSLHDPRPPMLADHTGYSNGQIGIQEPQRAARAPEGGAYDPSPPRSVRRGS